MKILRLIAKTGFLTTWMFFGFLLAYGCALRLRFAPPFRSLFGRMCVYTPADEVAPLLAIFLFGVVSAIACFVILYRRSAVVRQRVFGVIVATISFTAGVLLTSWI